MEQCRNFYQISSKKRLVSKACSVAGIDLRDPLPDGPWNSTANEHKHHGTVPNGIRTTPHQIRVR